MSKITFAPIPALNITTLSAVTGGQVFCFYEDNVDILKAVNNEAIYMVVKDSNREGCVKVINLKDGLILSRDSDRKIVKLSSEFRISIIGTQEACQ